MSKTIEYQPAHRSAIAILFASLHGGLYSPTGLFGAIVLIFAAVRPTFARLANRRIAVTASPLGSRL